MSNVALRVEGLSKQYRIGKQERYRTFRDTITDAVTAPARRVAGLLHGNAAAAANLTETIWALKDINFEVKHGEVVGIIGRNGAGKSTLLKILSRITEPTTGYADVYGRVGALLEVGTGFHPELTGRENIFLNGAILGMSREEIRRKFDEIVDFAGVEKFIDTPVKHYSSGMGLRLGFAVAAYLEPEILIVDEVLAVGDAEFQKKCMGKMSDVAGEGRTVLFVSHNMAAVQQLCTRSILIASGNIIGDASTNEMVGAYLSQGAFELQAFSLAERKDREGTGEVKVTEVTLLNEQMIPVAELMAASTATFLLRYQSIDRKPVKKAELSLRIEDEYGRYLFTASSWFTGQEFDLLPDQGIFFCSFPSLPLAAGEYSVYISFYSLGKRMDSIHDALRFRVLNSDVYGTGRTPNYKKHGPIIVGHSWEFRTVSSDTRIDAL